MPNSRTNQTILHRSKPQRISGTVKQFVCVVAALLTLDVSFVKAGGSFSILDRPGARVTNASDLNTQGQIVGTFSDQAQRVHGFIYTGGSFSTLDGPWPGYTFLTDINAHEQIVGYFRDHITGNNHGFIYADGAFSIFNRPGAKETVALGINDQGQIVGDFSDQDQDRAHGFIYAGGVFSTLDAPGARSTVASGINDQGQIVGYFDDQNRSVHGFIYRGGVFSTLNAPGSNYTVASGINDQGQIVGDFSDQTGGHGFIYAGGVFSALDPPGSNYTIASGINDQGQIVGDFSDQTGGHGFLYIPSAASKSKNLGDCAPCMEGNPINAATGNKAQAEMDFVGGPNLLLALRRVYNSQDTTATGFGVGWRGTWHRTLKQVNATTITATRESGRVETFTKTSTGLWQGDPDLISRLVAVTGGWRLTTADDNVEAYLTDGRLTSITTRAGIILTLTYDTLKRLTRVADPFGHAMIFTYDTANRISQMTAPGGGLYKYTYDAKHNLTSVTYPDLKVRRYVYESTSYPNALTGIVDENGVRFATYAYNPRGQAISSQHVGGVNKTTVTYNANGTSGVTDPRGNLHTYALTTQFDMVKPTAVTGVPVPNAGGKAFTYDAKGFLASRTDFNGRVTTYIHDARGNETSRTEAAGTPQARTISTTWHSTLHVPTRIVEPNRVTDIVLDVRGNPLITTVTAGGKTRRVTATYDAVGHVKTMDGARTDAVDITTINWGVDGNPLNVTNARGHITRYTWDAAGRPKTITDPNGLVTTFSYTPRGFLSSVAEGTELTRYDRNAVGDVTRITFPDRSFLNYTYDQAHRLTGITDALGNRIAYTLDAASNVTKENVFDPAQVLARTQSRAYDTVNRLAQLINAQGKITNFTYDANSNRLTQKTTRGTAVTTETYVIAPPSNRLSSITTETTTRTLAHDVTGNQTGDGTGTWLYDARNRLVRVSKITGSADYLINGLGERVRKTGALVPGGAVHFLYEGSRLLGEYSATGAPLQETVWLGDLPVMVIKPTANYFITPDHRGAPHAITLATGRPVRTWNPDPFGTTAPNQNPSGAGIFVYNLRYPGQYFDAETGAHYNMARDYNPGIGRYIQSDPIGLVGGVNTYGYVGGNPVNRIDSLGLCCAWKDVWNDVGKVWDTVKDYLPQGPSPVDSACEAVEVAAEHPMNSQRVLLGQANAVTCSNNSRMKTLTCTIILTTEVLLSRAIG